MISPTTPEQAQGELLVAAFTGGMLRQGLDLMESHVVPTILIYHLGIDSNKGLNAGDRARMAAAADDELDRDEFARAGMPVPPPVSVVPIADRPPSNRW